MPLAIGLERLTDRQRRLLRLLASGATAGELAARLGLTVSAAQRECQEVQAALGVNTPAEAALLWWGSRAGARVDVRLAAEHLVAAEHLAAARAEQLAA
jgi:DNA-binding NarL/FixJ family response regulator